MAAYCHCSVCRRAPVRVSPRSLVWAKDFPGLRKQWPERMLRLSSSFVRDPKRRTLGGPMSVISALGLYILVSVFSGGTESDARWKILVIAVVSGIVQALISSAIPDLIGLFLAIAASLG